ncbi:MAG: 3-dehydroquinate synthase [Acidobacteria bacterium]|nr:3-dehydroquinate synthase [Acidobacteriota bacterium]
MPTSVRLHPVQEEFRGIQAPFSVPFVHRLHFTRDAFAPENHTLDEVVREGTDRAPRAVVFFDRAVSEAWPGILTAARVYAGAHGWEVPSIETLPGGEETKNDPAVLEQVLRAIHDAKIDRQSFVIAVGGGAVLDVVGYAAAIAHRGVRLVRLPTTTLSQADSGVGVKNGINAFGKKNYLGTFSPPWAVMNDETFLSTLSDRDWRCGFAEAVKVGLVKDAALFESIEKAATRIQRRDDMAALPVIRESAELHLRHITDGGDPFELISARPLDFGHWAAHKLEQMTDFRLRHGEAVAIGLALDTTYSVKIGLLDPPQGDRVLHCLSALGFRLYNDAMADSDTLLAGLDEFCEHLGGVLTLAMLRGIGNSVDIHEIEAGCVRESIEHLAQRG